MHVELGNPIVLPITMPEEQNLPEAETSESDTAMTRRKGSSRYVARSMRGFVRWLPSGAAGLPMLSMLLQQEWAMALLMFPANIVAAVWAAYSDGFIDTLEGIYAERSKTDARSL